MNPLSEKIRERAVELGGDDDVNDKLMSIVGDAPFVLVGEASHGTHQFYKNRAEITKKLITDKGFTGIAVEADFPDAYRVNRYVRCEGGDRSADGALSDFKRYPLWMWRNTEVRDFIEWLREFNSERPAAERVGFYGMDLYSLHSSMEAVLKYLDTVDPEAAKRARYRYSCFDHFGEDPQHYGYAASYDMESSCEQQVIAQLAEIREHAAELVRRDGFVARDEFFFAEQNARLVKNAEEYYRQMFRGHVSSWNLRDQHMTETLFALRDHLAKDGRPPKIAVWAHNSHLGDARATDMGGSGEWNAKILTLNGKKEPLHSYLAELYAVIFNADTLDIVRGHPEARRHFLDDAIVSLSPPFVQTFTDYNRVIKQKNALLQRARDAETPLERVAENLEPWNEQLAALAARIHRGRVRIVERLNEVLQKHLFGTEEITIRYVSSLEGKGDLSQYEELISERLKLRVQAELVSGHSLIGPHRDDLEVLFDGRDLRKYGSAGQQRSALLVLQLANIEVFRSTRGENPLFLIDDIDAELDYKRIGHLLDYLADKTQTFASTSKESFVQNFGSTAVVFGIQNGRQK